MLISLTASVTRLYFIHHSPSSMRVNRQIYCKIKGVISCWYRGFEKQERITLKLEEVRVACVASCLFQLLNGTVTLSVGQYYKSALYICRYRDCHSHCDHADNPLGYRRVHWTE